MSLRRSSWAVAAAVLVGIPTGVRAADPVPTIPPPGLGAMPEPVGRPTGYHQKHYGGIGQGTLPSIWRDLDEVYRENMHDVFTYKSRKWRYGYPVGYGIGANCQAGGPFGLTERCGLAPLHYRVEAPTVFTAPRPALTGETWYRLEPAITAPVPGPAVESGPPR